MNFDIWEIRIETKTMPRTTVSHTRKSWQTIHGFLKKHPEILARDEDSVRRFVEAVFSSHKI
ncbi:MAG: hypothetical protein LBE97_01970 [Holosporales bacterium]|nr:hypothetical protein [Holosporales bacterium]